MCLNQPGEADMEHDQDRTRSQALELALVLSDIPAPARLEMARRLREAGFETRKNGAGMVMVSMTDSFDTPFYLGEALAREAMVVYQDVAGYGLVLVDDEQSAFIAACADAARRAGDRKTQEWINTWTASHAREHEARLAREKAMVKSTKVNFGLMAEG
jgi:phosphonate C-P lyase system protein PhnG